MKVCLYQLMITIDTNLTPYFSMMRNVGVRLRLMVFMTWEVVKSITKLKMQLADILNYLPHLKSQMCNLLIIL